MGKKSLPLNSPAKILVVVLLGICFILFGIFFFLQTHQVFSANFADDVLRPLIGNKDTIIIESIFFAAQDTSNQIKYHFVKPDTHVFSDTRVKVNKGTTLTGFTLTPIPLDHVLQSGEGVWVPIGVKTKDVLLAQTFLHPDPLRTYAIVAFVKMNMQKLSIGAAAGTWEPGEAAKRGPGMVPLPVQKSNMLVAAFNGGFQKKDGAYGMIVGNVTYLPLQKNLATLILYQNSQPKLINYTGQDLGENVVAVRQNGPMLIENGEIVANSHAWNMQTWGLTTTNSMYTWRSGLGVTKTGDIIYAVGSSLVPETLALSLQKAGAINAMQLDINPVWVRFVLYNSLGNGRYGFQMLLKEMSNGGLSYLTGYQKDFFYVYRKADNPLADSSAKSIP